MERFAWKGRIKPGMQAEYKRRHDEIWPEMKQVLKDAGICNYTIWSDGETLFGYYECEKGIAYAEQAQAGSPVVDRWNEYMQQSAMNATCPYCAARSPISRPQTSASKPRKSHSALGRCPM